VADYIFKRLSIDDLVPGMVLEKMIVTADGQTYLAESVVRMQRTIQKLFCSDAAF
jgi:hypothetical protein